MKKNEELSEKTWYNINNLHNHGGKNYENKDKETGGNRNGSSDGCGTVSRDAAGRTKATPENLLRDMTDKAEKVESTVMNVKFNIKLSSRRRRARCGTMDMDMEATTEPEASHGKGEVSFDIAGSSMSTEMEMYSVKEDDQYVTYTMLEGQWTKEAAGEEEATGRYRRDDRGYRGLCR